MLTLEEAQIADFLSSLYLRPDDPDLPESAFTTFLGRLFCMAVMISCTLETEPIRIDMASKMSV